MRAKVGEVYLDTDENKLFEIRARRWGEYKISGYCTYFSDTRMSLPACESFIDECYLSRYCERVELYSNLLVRDINGVRVRLKEDDIKTVIRSPFNYPAEVGGIYYDEKDNRLFKLLAIRQDDLIISTKWMFYKNALENNSSHWYMNIQYFNRYCVIAHQDSSFLAKESGLSRVPKQPTKTDAYRAHVIEKSICVTPKRSRVRELTIKDIVENKTYKKLKEQIDKLNIGEVIKLSKLLHGRTYGIMGGRE